MINRWFLLFVKPVSLIHEFKEQLAETVQVIFAGITSLTRKATVYLGLKKTALIQIEHLLYYHWNNIFMLPYCALAIFRVNMGIILNYYGY